MVRAALSLDLSARPAYFYMANIFRRFTRCPHCRTVLDAHATLADGGPPQTGDYTVCAGCGMVLRYTVDDVRPVTEEDLRNMDEATREDLTDAARMARAMAFRREAEKN